MTIHPTALVETPEGVAPSVVVWHYAHLRSGVKVDDGAVIGRGVYVGPDVHIGARAKIQNHAMIYEPTQLDEGVFIGPGVVLTNDRLPRAINADGTAKSVTDWEPVGVVCRSGASIGAGSICVAPVEIGEWAMVGAGSVVTRDVPAHALVLGNPARQVGWVSRCGVRLAQVDGGWECPVSGEQYVLSAAGRMIHEEA